MMFLIGPIGGLIIGVFLYRESGTSLKYFSEANLIQALMFFAPVWGTVVGACIAVILNIRIMMAWMEHLADRAAKPQDNDSVSDFSDLPPAHIPEISSNVDDLQKRYWFYKDHRGGHQGPFEEDVLLDLFRTGQLRTNTLVWTKELGDMWIEARNIDGLLPDSLMPPPVE